MKNHLKIEEMLNNCNKVIDRAMEQKLTPTDEIRATQLKTQLIVQLLTLKARVGLDADQSDLDIMEELTNDLIVLIEAQLLVSCN